MGKSINKSKVAKWVDYVKKHKAIVLTAHEHLTRDEMIAVRNQCERLGLRLPETFYFDYKNQEWF